MGSGVGVAVGETVETGSLGSVVGVMVAVGSEVGEIDCAELFLVASALRRSSSSASWQCLSSSHWRAHKKHMVKRHKMAMPISMDAAIFFV